MSHLALVQPCEAAFALSRPAQTGLSEGAKTRAFDFILEFGTNLQRERLSYHFPIENSAAAPAKKAAAPAKKAAAPSSNKNVLAALAHYQNEDGGFGHGLEPDLRTKKSTTIATTVALQILESVDGQTSLMADDAIQYLMNDFHNDNWEPIHAEANDAPHAPWWRYEAPAGQGFTANPTAEVLRYLFNHRAMSTQLPGLLAQAVEHIKSTPLEMHEFLCFIRLYECQVLTKPDRMDLLPYLLSNGYQLVNVEPRDWEEYCLTPLDVVTHAGSVFAEFFTDSIDANFDFLLEQQQEDGSWCPNWSWAGEFPATWKRAKTEIKAELTLKNLQQFAAFKRL
jgi:hypothetical protein